MNVVIQQGRPLTPTEIEVILDRIFSGKKRLRVKADLKKLLINPNGSVQASSATSVDYETLVDLAELRDIHEAELLEEAEGLMEGDKDVKKQKKERESKTKKKGDES